MDGSSGSGGVLKKKSSSGCLIIRKKVENRNPGGVPGGFVKSKERKSYRVMEGDSSESDEDDSREFLPRKANDQILHNGSMGRRSYGFDNSEYEGSHSRAGFNGERKRNRLGAMHFDEYSEFDQNRMRNQYSGGGEFSQHGGSGKRNEGLYPVFRNRQYGMEEDEADTPVTLSRLKYEKGDKTIRVQGKNGVLKIMVNKRRKMGSVPHKYNFSEARRVASPLSEDFPREDLLAELPCYQASLPSASNEVLKIGKAKTIAGKNGISKKTGSNGINTSSKAPEIEGTDTALKLGPPGLQGFRVKKGMKKEEEEAAALKNVQPVKMKEVKDTKPKRGGSTEKQILREKIRGMLIEAGWKIDYRPRKNRDYLDAVYINRNGTAYWSIIKAYEALKKQLEEDKAEIKPDVCPQVFSPLSEDLINKLTRQTKKKMEEEMKRKLKEGICDSRNALGEDGESSGSEHEEEKLAPFTNPGSNSGKGKLKDVDPKRSYDLSKYSSKKKKVRSEKPSMGSDADDSRRGASETTGRCILQVRGSDRGHNSVADGCSPFSEKRTILAWLIDSGTVQLSQKVKYMNRKRSCAMLEGWITRDGIHCCCCSKILTLSKFELHAGSKLRQPFQNIFLESGASLLNCQLEAWNKQEESVICGFHKVSVGGDEPMDDICSICWEGGTQICCNNCPSTFHPQCLEIKTSTPDDWICASCMCKICGNTFGNVAECTDDDLMRCGFCLEKYHMSCCGSYSIPSSSNWAPFCGVKCQEMYDQLQNILGVKHELGSGFSWSLLRRAEVFDASHRAFPQFMECNSKLAVALSLMNECFLPIFDPRTGINIFHNVVYSIRSMLNRLNYQSFFTAVLERGDEIVSAACLRIHGSRLAEIPFIATREAYRQQGMCRRLLTAIETALIPLKVEHLIIPVLPEQTTMWIRAFAFHQVEDSLKKEMVKSMDLLVFPGTHLLKKDLLKQETLHGTRGLESTNKLEKTHNSSRSPAAMLTDNSSATASDSVSESDSLPASYENNRDVSQVGNKITPSSQDNPESPATESSSANCADFDDKDADTEGTL